MKKKKKHTMAPGLIIGVKKNTRANKERPHSPKLKHYFYFHCADFLSRDMILDYMMKILPTNVNRYTDRKRKIMTQHLKDYV